MPKNGPNRKSTAASKPKFIQPNRIRTDADRRINQADRFAKILKILELIQGNGRWNARALAQEFECTEKTVYRYLSILTLAGIPYYFDDENQGYRLRPDFRFASLNLTDDELLGQAVATVASRAPGLSAGVGATPTTRKLSERSEKKGQRILAEAERLVAVLGLQMVDHSRHREIIHTIQWALINGKQVSGRYETPYETRPHTIKLQPFRLCLIKNAWYVIGRADRLEGIRTFRVARFKSLRATDAEAEIPADFDLKDYFGNAWAVYRGQQSYDVRLRFTADASRIVTETIWHNTQRVQEHRDGSITMSFMVDGLEEILNWILGWTGRVTILEPDELRQLVMTRLQAGIAMNSEISS